MTYDNTNEPLPPRAIVELMPRRANELSPAAASIADVVEQKRMIAECMQQVMKQDQHFGVVPGTNTKPCLFKPGAETLGFMFRLRAEYKVVSSVERTDFIKYRVRCTLTHIGSGDVWGSALATCNSRETKYVRPAPKKCPKCNGETIIIGRPEYERDPKFKGGWLCYQKKGGCGAKYVPDDQEIIGQPAGIADPSDLDNTILKMAEKRAHVAAVLGATAASDFFTQDLEDLTVKAATYEAPQTQQDDAREAEEAQAREQYRNAVGPAPVSVAPPKTSAGSAASPTASAGAAPALTSVGPSATKRPGAAQVPHEGVDLSTAQFNKIQALKRECGGIFTGEDSDPNGYWRTKVIRVYRNAKGERLESSKELSKNQASHLIDRLLEYKAKVEARAAQPVDLGAVLPEQPQPPPPAPDLETLIGERFQVPAQAEIWLVNLFDKTEVGALDAEESRLAFQLLLANGTPDYERILKSARALSIVKPEEQR